jgi:hypothetical protein
VKRTQPNGLEVYRRATVIPSQRWGWTIWSQGRRIAVSGEGYSSKAYAEWMGARVCSGEAGIPLLTAKQFAASREASYLLDGGK